MDARYPNLFISPTVRWQINPRTHFSTTGVGHFNARTSGDIRANNETDLNIQITPLVGLQQALLVAFDRKPVDGYGRTNVQFQVNIAFSLMRGQVP